MAQEKLRDMGKIDNPFKGTGYVAKAKQERRDKLASKARLRQLEQLVQSVEDFLRKGPF